MKFLKRLAVRYLRRRNKINSNAILQMSDMTPVRNFKPENASSVIFVLPDNDINAFGGGTTSVFRIANGLFARGLKIYITTAGGMHSVEIKSSVNRLFHGKFKPEIVSCDCLDNCQFDILIATSWQTAYYIRKYNGYKMYFVQDYEPYFAVRGDMYYLADKSYGLGYHMVSLGNWNRKMILDRYPDALIDTIEFPFDNMNYKHVQRSGINDKSIIKAAVYLRNTPRRLPNITEWICEKLVELFNKDGRQLQVYYFGDDMRAKVNIGINMGTLGWEELISLYNECDFGMVFSYTNISLVPYEMMATGLPVIELKEGTFTYFMPEHSAILFDGDIDKMYKNLVERLTNSDFRNQIDLENRNLLSKRTWEKSIDMFCNIIKGV